MKGDHRTGQPVERSPCPGFTVPITEVRGPRSLGSASAFRSITAATTIPVQTAEAPGWQSLLNKKCTFQCRLISGLLLLPMVVGSSANRCLSSLKGQTQLSIRFELRCQVRCWSEKYVTVSVKAPSVSSLIKYSTSKLTGVQNYKSQLVPIGLVNL